jgi:hypothetical protein
MTEANEVVFRPDVDNTLLDNNRIVADLGDHFGMSLATRAGIDIGKFTKRRVLNSAVRAAWTPCSASYPPADIRMEPIGDLVNCGLPALLGAFKADYAQ